MVSLSAKIYRQADIWACRSCSNRILFSGSRRQRLARSAERGIETALSITNSKHAIVRTLDTLFPPKAFVRRGSWGASASNNEEPAIESKPIVVVGSINADIVVEVDRLPKKGETLSATGGGSVIPGGKGANQAAAAALLAPNPTYMVGQVGRDTYGETLKTALSKCNVLLTHVVEVEQPSGQAIVMLQPDGDNSIIIIGAANRAWESPSDEALSAVAGAGALLLQREVPEEVNLAAARVARDAGVLVVLDAGGEEGPLPVELLCLVDVLSPNETELARLTDLPTTTHEEVTLAAKHLLDRGVQQVLVKLGSEGSLLITNSDPEPTILTQPAIPAPEVVDTTGAGDTFTAAFAVATLQGLGAQEAMEFAAAAASLCVQKYGAQPSLPSLEDTTAWLAQWKTSA